MVNLSKLSESLKELIAEHNLNQVMLAEKLNTGRTIRQCLSREQAELAFFSPYLYVSLQAR